MDDQKLGEQLLALGKRLWDARVISVDEADVLIDAESKLKWLEKRTAKLAEYENDETPTRRELALVKRKLDAMEREKRHWWVLACQRFADLTKIAESSEKPDDYEWYGAGLDAGIPRGIDESNNGDWHDHGFAMGVWSMAMEARKALSTIQPTETDQ